MEEWMSELRKQMMSLHPTKRGRHIKLLSELYSCCQTYPLEPALDTCEIEVSSKMRAARGGFAGLWRGLFLGKHEVGMKAPHFYVPDETAQRRVQRETGVWRRLKHPHVLPFIGWHTLGLVSYMISPWMKHGDAVDYLQTNPTVDPLPLLVQVAEGLSYLHNFQPELVVHGDLTGRNILISHTGDALIADFGQSELVVEGEPTSSSNSASWYLSGNIRWKAPEIFEPETKQQGRRTKETDIFAFGRVMLQFFTRQVPFAHILNDRDDKLKTIARRGDFPERPCAADVVARGLDDGMWQLMTECWDVNPGHRPSADNILLRLSSALEARNNADHSQG
ncbi:hypothetical protein BOTBODRAFT_505351 [Botryobasidium botryosum FD-172 SS1]|uniref:Protein kinase domain-containing protein n=1 Tax=Botryobasidium botryosum (strain FD-172 SS1) TaxID=930990 RepID=A0A067M2W0_BOTB1|nr:hypothetical protein BOTBODRAFT_505351 [Botryobasidium botryosum FD-172 SS1]